MIHKQLFPPAILALQQEVLHHPTLLKLLENHPSSEFEVRFAEIAAYCNVLMDDEYTEEDFCRIAEILIQKLRSKRISIILPPT